MKYYIYNTSGKILRTGSTSRTKEQIRQSLKEGEFLGVGKADDVTQIVVDGKTVTGKNIQKPPQMLTASKMHLTTKHSDQTIRDLTDRVSVLEAYIERLKELKILPI